MTSSLMTSFSIIDSKESQVYLKEHENEILKFVAQKENVNMNTLVLSDKGIYHVYTFDIEDSKEMDTKTRCEAQIKLIKELQESINERAYPKTKRYKEKLEN